MAALAIGSRLLRRAVQFGALAFAALAAAGGAGARDQQSKIDVLRIGASGTFSTQGGAANEKSSLETLRSFIKDETGLDNEIVREKHWRDLLAKMAKGQEQVGVFQGYEYAWAQAQSRELQPLAVAVNIYVYPVAYVVTRKDNAAKDFGGLQGHSIATVAGSPGHLQLYVDRQCQALGKSSSAFFSKVVASENFEAALDDVVDGTVDATAADRSALEAYKARKPGRFNQLRPVAQSQPFPPPVVAYYGNYLDEATRERFRNGLLNANKSERGQTMLTLFRLTEFQPPPADFEKVLAATRAAYPPENGKSK